MQQPYYVKVALQTPVYHCLDYLPPTDYPLNKLQPGMRCKVPLVKQHVVGIIVAITQESAIEPKKLRPVAQIIDDVPLLPADLLRLMQWASAYYHYYIGEVVIGMLPKSLREGKPATLDQETVYCLSSQTIDETRLARAPKQLDAIRYLQSCPQGATQSQLKKLGFDTAIINALLAKQFAVKTTITTTPETKLYTPRPAPFALNEEQQQATQKICAALNTFTPFLLQGITGSGKTEVYFQCIDKVLQQQQQVLFIVPEIGLTPQTISRLQARFHVPIAVMHSGCTDKERMHSWLRAKNNELRIILGTRSAVFTPMPQLGLIIIDESHDPSLKQQDGFRYSGRDVAVRRAQLTHIPIILGTATPTLESLHNAQHGRYQHLRLTQRAGNASAPRCQIIDIRNQTLENGLSPPAITQIKRHLTQQKQVLIFLNRRGYAPCLICHSCGWVAKCERCDANYTVHQNPPRLHCHHCESSRRLLQQCPHCITAPMIAIGQGTERIEQSLQQLFPQHDVLRIDRDSTRRKGSLESLLQTIHHGRGQILVGTQMLAKGHHFPNVTLAIILDADSGFFSADFRACERMAQLIVQVAGRSGRSTEPGEVLIQTRNPEHPMLTSLLQQGYDHFMSLANQERQLANFPPYTHLALFRAEAPEQKTVTDYLNQIRQLAQQSQVNPVNFFGPSPAPMERRQGRYRGQLLIQSPNRQSLHILLTHLQEKLPTIPGRHKVRWSLDVDPIDLF